MAFLHLRVLPMCRESLDAHNILLHKCVGVFSSMFIHLLCVDVYK